MDHQSKSTTGPVRHMAIESIKRGKYSEKSDVWAFAVTAWEVHNRAETPYGRDISGIDAVRKVIAGDRLQYPESLPEGVRDLYQRCMAVSPTKRPSFADCVGCLDELSTTEEIVYASLAGIRDDDTAVSTANLDEFRQ
jgi:c-src tyrosine kinase